jgi:hypothetical protein
MLYHLILINDMGTMSEHTVDLPVTPQVTWQDFEQLTAIKQLLLLNPTMRLHDITPDGMPDWFTDDDWMRIQQAHTGGKSQTVLLED